LQAAIDVIDAQEKFWPLSVRQVHYRLLGPNAPLRHASKPRSRYRNDKASYKDLTDLLARGRLEGFVSWEAIDDETRPVELNAHVWNVGDFVKREMEWLLTGYVRNKQQSQPHHIELVGEKLTVKAILESVASKYWIPFATNRGMSGPTVKKKVEQRFLR